MKASEMGAGHTGPRGPAAAATVFGIPVGGFGLLSSLLLGIGAGFLVFFAATFLAIMALLLYSSFTHHAVNYADSYLYVGGPLGALVLVAATGLMLWQWIAGRLRGEPRRAGRE
jgi:hypothetical protein